MEMQQVRYFVALAETLNFTRAAEQCSVTQPALTRAIKALEQEFGGELILREGRLTQLTELGRKMLPLLRQCYDSALSAKAVAQSVASGEISSLSLGLSRTVDLRLIGDALAELIRAFPSLRLNLRRGNGEQLAAMLQSGEVEIILAGPIEKHWDRMDAWPLFSETFDLLVSLDHALAAKNSPDIRLAGLNGQTFLLQGDSETAAEEVRQLNAAGIPTDRTHMVESDGDLAALVQANIGVALVPRSFPKGAGVVRHMSPDIEVRRTLAIYTAAGRRRSPAAGTLIRQIRAQEWSDAARARVAV